MLIEVSLIYPVPEFGCAAREPTRDRAPAPQVLRAALLDHVSTSTVSAEKSFPKNDTAMFVDCSAA